MGALVDYSSSSSDEDETSELTTTTKTAAASSSSLPPLPKAFHDLYASTVRTSTGDDPSLHHGRTRGIPHVAGQWPSHISIEWFPSPQEHTRLRALVTALRMAIQDTDLLRASTDIHSSLTSDLGTPLPLHISLSRSFVLQTAHKDDFLENLVSSISSSKVEPFDVRFSKLSWFRNECSDRGFLVLGVETVRADRSGRVAAPPHNLDRNAPLQTLLGRCNKQVAAVGQPQLYARVRSPQEQADCFHVSVAWTLSKNIVFWQEKTAEVYAAWRRDGEGETAVAASSSAAVTASPADSTSLPTTPLMTSGGSISVLTPPGSASASSPPPISETVSDTTSIGFHVDSIKVKIGNAVTDIPLGKKPRMTNIIA